MKPFHEQFRTVQYYWTDPHWLSHRMLFLSGPRQVGKTTLVTSTLCTKQEAYFNWDSRKVRMLYHKDPEFIANTDSEWICFDEVHKRPKWKDILKGIYDVYKGRYHFVITGSAKLETFRRSGDSLVGRYFHTRLFPLNLPDFAKTDFTLPKNPEELARQAAEGKEMGELESLLQLGGFPEPYFSSSEQFWKRWAVNHLDLIIREDLKDLTKVVEIDKIEHLLEIIKPSIGQTISYRHLGQDLETTHGSIKRWLEILNRLQVLFPIAPYFKKIRRAYRQERKWYYVDWRIAEEKRFENYIAASLLRAVTLYSDRFGEAMSLHFVRTHDGAEVDFLLCRDNKPWLLIEAKEGSPDITSSVHRFSRELNVPCFIVTRKKNIFKQIKGKEGQKIFCISWGKLGPLLP